MKYLFITFAQALSSVVVLAISFLCSVLLDGMWLKADSNANIITADNRTLEVFFKMFGPAARSLPLICAISLFLIALLYMYNMFKTVFGPMVDAENPFKMTGKVLLYATGIYLVKPLINLAFNIATIPFIEIDKNLSMGNQMWESAKQGFSISGIIGGSFGETFKNILIPIVDTVLFSVSDVAFFIFVFMFIAILIEFLKFFIEVVTRYVLLGVLTIFAPLALACGAFQKTAQIFDGWWKAFVGQIVLIMFSHFFLKVFVFSWTAFTLGRFVSGIPLLTGLAMIFAWLKIGQKADTYLQTMGAGTLKTGDDLSLALLGAFRFGAEPAAKLTNTLKGGPVGTFFGQKNPSFTFDKAKQGNTSGTGNGKWKSPFDMSSHSTARNIARNIIPGKTGAMGSGANMFDNALGEFASEATNGENSAWSISPDLINDALAGKFGFTKSATHKGIDRGIENLFGSSSSSKSPLSGANISKAVIDPNTASIAGRFDNGNTSGGFKLIDPNNALGMANMSDNEKDSVQLITDPFGKTWNLLTDEDGGGLNTDISSGASDFISTVNTGAGNIGSDLMSGLQMAGGLNGSSMASMAGNTISNAYSEGSISPGTPILQTGSGAFALNSSSVSHNGDVIPNTDGTITMQDGQKISAESLLGRDSSGVKANYFGLTQDNEGVIANIPMSDGLNSFAIVEGLNQTTDGSYVSAPISTAGFIRDISGGEIMPNTTRYSMESSTGYIDVNSFGDNNKSIINSSNGPIYTESFEQSRANASMQSGCMLNDINSGIFELDISRTLSDNGSYIPGNPIYSTDGSIHNMSNIQLNDSGGFAIFEQSSSSPYFAGQDGRVYEALKFSDSGEIQMYASGDSGILQETDYAESASDIQVFAKASDGSTNYVTPQRVNNGRVSSISYSRVYNEDPVVSEYNFNKKV